MDAMTAQAAEPGYFQRAWRLRHFWMSLVRLDLRARYRRSVLGIGWSLVRPLAMCLVLCVVFAKLFRIDDIAGYAPFLLLGLSVWQFLTEATTLGCTSFTGASVYIRQQPLPLAIFPLRTVLGAGFHALIALGVAVVVLSILRGPANLLGLPALLVALPIIFIAGWATAVLTGLAHAHFPDTQHLLEIGLQILFYASPIMYPPEALQGHPGVRWIIDLNPITYFLEIVRRPLLLGTLPPPQVYAVAAGCAGVLAFVAARALRRLEKTLVFWL